MTKTQQRRIAVFSGVFWTALLGAQEPAVELDIEHANCSWFDGGREKQAKQKAARNTLGRLTDAVAAELSGGRAAARADTSRLITAGGTIDRHIFQGIQDAGVTPAGKTTDFEFIRRVRLDLTGRIPKPEEVTAFVADTSANKRQVLVDTLLARPEWADKWTMYFGDLYKNNTRNSQVARFPSGVAAFQKWIRDSLGAGKPYSQMARELITASEGQSYENGAINFLAGGVVTGGPVQDIFDQQAADIFRTFLGISHMNCVLCHNGRGHLDSLSLWGKSASRMEAWQVAAFLSHTNTRRASTPGAVGGNPYYWFLEDDTRYRTDYALNTTTGNRPARRPAGSVTRVAPVYLFSGKGPSAGENYRAALAREITQDFQFARATVNYIWAEFFGKGLVEPVDGFDPARLDPDSPPTDGWTLQPSNARLLNALAQDLIDSRYDLKALMKQITTSEAYQLSARYEGTWNPAWDKLFARKFVRRLWAEEIHDAIAQSSGLLPNYNLAQYPGVGTVQFAMKFPETGNTPDNGRGVSQFLNAFLRGDRDTEDRRQDGSIPQALGLMNDTFVMARIRSTGNSNLLLVRNVNQNDEILISTLYLTVLSRFPSNDEKQAALDKLRSGNRSRSAEDLLWSLYNKVDFFFNY